MKKRLDKHRNIMSERNEPGKDGPLSIDKTKSPVLCFMPAHGEFFVFYRRAVYI